MKFLFLNKILASINSLKQQYSNKTPKEKYLLVINFEIFISRWIGMDLYDPKFKLYWKSYVVLLVSVNFFISLLYTIWYFLDQPLIALQATPLLGIVIPSLLIYWLILDPLKRFRYRHLGIFGAERIYKENIPKNAEFRHVLDGCAVKLLLSTSKTLGIIIGSSAFFSCFPIYAFLFKNEIQLPIAVLVPFTTMDTFYGLAINLGNQAFVNTVGIIGNCCVEIVSCVIKNTVSTCAAIINYSFDESIRLLDETKGHTLEYKVHFRNTLVQIQDYDRYVLELCDLYYWKFLVQPYLLMYTMSAAIFFYLYGGWIAGAGIFVILYGQLFIICDIGHEVESAKEAILTKLAVTSWDKFPLEHKKALIYVIHHLQHATTITMGPFAQLNYGTFLNMTKATYQIFMLMNQFME